MPITPEQRALRARLGAYSAMAKHGRHKLTEKARAANPSADAYWLAKVDPTLPQAEREQRAADLKRAHFAALAFKSARAQQEDRIEDRTVITNDDAPDVDGRRHQNIARGDAYSITVKELTCVVQQLPTVPANPNGVARSNSWAVNPASTTRTHGRSAPARHTATRRTDRVRRR